MTRRTPWTLARIRAGKATLLGDLAGWYSRPALTGLGPMPINPSEIPLARSLDRAGRAVLVSIEGKPYLQPATE